MDYLTQVNWHKLFVLKFSVLEILIRGVVIYVALCLLLRVVLKRQAGKVSLSDLLVVTIVAGVCRNPLVADAYPLPDGLGVVAEAWMESDGQVSVIKKEKPPAGDPPPAPPSAEAGSAAGASGAAVVRHNRLAGLPESANGTPQASPEAEGDEPDLRLFLKYARKVEGRIRWHEEQAAGHTARVRELKGALARWGFHPKSPPRRTSAAVRQHDREEHSAG